MYVFECITSSTINSTCYLNAGIVRVLNMSFTFSLNQPATHEPLAPVFIVHNDTLLSRMQNESLVLPTVSECRSMGMPNETFFSFGYDEGHIFAGDGTMVSIDQHCIPYEFHPFRTILPMVSPGVTQRVLCALHSVHWHNTSRFCGKCGTVMNFSSSEPAKVCSACGYLFYPRISPAVIVAVVHENKILLGHSHRFPGKFYSVLAGFVEPGETLEECVIREVKEETGIMVDTVTYFGSQPWPFPDSLMCAFTARYAAGTLCPDQRELTDAGWYTADALPEIPSGYSISRKLIDWFIEQHHRPLS